MTLSTALVRHPLYGMCALERFNSYNGYSMGKGIHRYLMSSQHSNKVLVEDGGFTQNKYR